MSQHGGVKQKLDLDPSSLKYNESLLAILQSGDDELFMNTSITPDSSAMGSTSHHTHNNSTFADSVVLPQDQLQQPQFQKQSSSNNNNVPMPNSRPVNPSLLLNNPNQATHQRNALYNTNISPPSLYNPPVPNNPLEPLSFAKVEIENAASSAALQNKQQNQQQSPNPPPSGSPSLAANNPTQNTTQNTNSSTIPSSTTSTSPKISPSDPINDPTSPPTTTTTTTSPTTTSTPTPIPINPQLQNLQGSSNLRKQIELNKNIPPLGFGGPKPKVMMDPFGKKQNETMLSRDPIIIPGVGIVDVSQYENTSSLLYCTVFFPSLPRMADQDIFFTQIRLPTDQTIKSLILTAKQQFHDDLLRVRAFTPGHVDSCLAAHIQANILKRRRQQLLNEDKQATIFSDPRYHVSSQLTGQSFYNSTTGRSHGHGGGTGSIAFIGSNDNGGSNQTLQSLVQPQPQPLMISQSSNINHYESSQLVRDPNLGIIYSKPPGYNPLLHTQRFQGELDSLEVQQTQLEQTAYENELRNEQIKQQQQQQQERQQRQQLLLLQQQEQEQHQHHHTQNHNNLSISLVDSSGQPTSITPTNQQQSAAQHTPQQHSSNYPSSLKKKQPMPGALALHQPPTPTSLSHSLTGGLTHSTSNLSSSTTSHSGSTGDALVRTQPLPLQQLQYIQQQHNNNQNNQMLTNQQQPEIMRRYTVDGLEGGNNSNSGVDGQFNNNPRSYYPQNQSILNKPNSSALPPTFSFDSSESLQAQPLQLPPQQQQPRQQLQQSQPQQQQQKTFQPPHNSSLRPSANLSGSRPPIPNHRASLHGSSSFGSHENAFQQTLPKHPTPSHSGSQFLSINKTQPVLDGSGSGSTSTSHLTSNNIIHHPNTTGLPPLPIPQFSHSSSSVGSTNNEDESGQSGTSVRVGRFSIQNIGPTSPTSGALLSHNTNTNNSSSSSNTTNQSSPTTPMSTPTRRTTHHQHHHSGEYMATSPLTTPSHPGMNYPPSPHHHSIGGGANPLASSGAMIYTSHSVLQPLSQSFPFQDSCPLDPSFLIEDIFGQEMDPDYQYQLCVWNEDNQQVDSNYPPLLDFTKLTHISHESFALVHAATPSKDDGAGNGNGKNQGEEVDRYGRRKLKSGISPLDILRQNTTGSSSGEGLVINPALLALGGGGNADSNTPSRIGAINPALLGGSNSGNNSSSDNNNNNNSNTAPQINPLLLQRGRGSTDRYGAGPASRGRLLNTQPLSPGLTAADISFSSTSSSLDDNSHGDGGEIAINPLLLGRPTTTINNGDNGKNDIINRDIKLNQLPQRNTNRYGPPQQPLSPQPGSLSNTSSEYGFANTGGNDKNFIVKQGLSQSREDDGQDMNITNGDDADDDDDDDQNLFTIHKSKDNKLVKTPPSDNRTTNVNTTTPGYTHMKNKNIDLSISDQHSISSPSSPNNNNNKNRNNTKPKGPSSDKKSKKNKKSEGKSHHTSPTPIPSPTSQSRLPPPPKRNWFARFFSCFSTDDKSILEDDFGYREQELQNTPANLPSHDHEHIHHNHNHDPFSVDTDESDVDIYVKDQNQIKTEMASMQQQLQNLDKHHRSQSQLQLTPQPTMLRDSVNTNDRLSQQQQQQRFSPQRLQQQQSTTTLQHQHSTQQLFPPTTTRMASLSHSHSNSKNSSAPSNYHGSPSFSDNNNFQRQMSNQSSQLDNDYENSTSNSDISWNDLEDQ